MKLYLIGNGFDLAHGLKTSYKNFREFLTKKYNIKYNFGEILLPNSIETKDGEIIYDRKEVLETIFCLIEEQNPNDWSDFETKLGNIDYKQFMPDTAEFDEEHPFRYGYLCEDVASTLKDFIYYIKGEFNEWIQTIRFYKTKKIFKLCMDSFYLTFNYTDTLEKIYGISSCQICHIHGKKGNEIMVGHNNERDFEQELSCFTMADITLSDIHDSLRKDSSKAYSDNMDFFKKIYASNITEIYNIGLSLSDVDLYYLEKIFQNTHTENIVFYISKHDYDMGKFEVFSKKLKLCGFKGKIKLYNF